MDYDFWRCDECLNIFPAKIEQAVVRIQQRTERNYGTSTTVRPIETLVVCPTCHERFRRPR